MHINFHSTYFLLILRGKTAFVVLVDTALFCVLFVRFDIYMLLACVVCLQAAELSIKFLGGDRAVEVIQVVGPRLTHLRKYNAVSEHKHTCFHLVFIAIV